MCQAIGTMQLDRDASPIMQAWMVDAIEPIGGNHIIRNKTWTEGSGAVNGNC